MVRLLRARGGGTRLEVRLGDGSANPYPTVAAILFAGLHGVRESLPLQPPIAGDGTGAAPDERGIPLARSLEASLAALGQDEVLRALLSPELVDTFLQL